MATGPTGTDTQLLAELNDLLQLDHDAVQAYTLAISLLRDENFKRTLTSYRADHERHIRELGDLIRQHGGTPLELPHLPTGAFKLAVQAAGRAGGDTGVLLAFKANERQVRDKYRRLANRGAHPAEVALVLQRNANDEAVHYSWVLETLEDLGAGMQTTAGRMENAFETVHARVADVTEGVERRGMQFMADATSRVPESIRRHPARAAAMAVAAVAAVGFALSGRRR